jgi:hypothetical protein
MNQVLVFGQNATPGPVSKVYRNAGLLMGNHSEWVPSIHWIL